MPETPEQETELEATESPPLSKREARLALHQELKRTISQLGSRPLVMPIIIAVNLAVFIAMAASGVNVLEPLIIDIVTWGGNFGPLTLSGEWWRLGSSMFLHIGLMHLLFNMVVLWDTGRVVERLLGHTSFFVMYAVSGLLGSVASLAWNENVVSAGASGAVFGVFGCLLGLLLRQRDTLPTEVRNRLAKSALILVGYNLVFGAAAEGIDMAAHVGGLIAGFGCGLFLALPSAASELDKRRRAGGLAGLGLIAICIGVVLLPASTEGPALVNSKQVVRDSGHEVYYGDGATSDDARAVSQVLRAVGFFQEGQQASALVSKEKGQYLVGLVVLDSAISNPTLESGFRSVAAGLSSQAFAGQPVVIALLNNHLETKKRLEPVSADEFNEQSGQPELLMGLDLQALRRTSLYQGLEPAFRATFEEQEAEGLPVSCSWQLVTQLQEVLLRHYLPPNEGYLLVIRGISRDVLTTCVDDLAKTGETLSITHNDVSSTLSVEGTLVALHWLDETSFLMEVSASTQLVEDPAHLQDRVSSRPGYDGSEALVAAAAKVDKSAVLWLARAKPDAHMQFLVDEQVEFYGQFLFRDDAAAAFMMDYMETNLAPVLGLPSVSSLLNKFSSESDNGTLTISATFTLDTLNERGQGGAPDAAFMQHWE